MALNINPREKGRNAVFVNMGFATPKAGKEKVMAASMLSFADALRGMPGLVETYVVAETDGKTFVGISIWEGKNAFESAMQNVRPPPPPEPVEEFRAAPPIIRQFESI